MIVMHGTRIPPARFTPTTAAGVGGHANREREGRASTAAAGGRRSVAAMALGVGAVNEGLDRLVQRSCAAAVTGRRREGEIAVGVVVVSGRVVPGV